jgi:DNA primase
VAGLIKREDIDEVRARTRIDDVVAGYVALRPAGVDSLKGLCPFHDEKTPSFHVRPHAGRWHCFGCGEGGDAISFIEKIEHVTFVEAVEILARKAGVELHSEDTGRADSDGPKRSRLVEAHRVAVEFYEHELHTPGGAPGRQLLERRGFTPEQVARYRIGFSPESWDGLLKVLRSRGFSEKEILAAGLAVQGNRGLYDRFRGRLMWPIFSIMGDPVGFGARRITDDDNGPKYLNTPETPIYKKAQVLYGLDQAKKAIAAQRRVVVVEGYTDVMAAQLAGVECAVATCGTAFGAEHVKIVRRLIGDGADPAKGVILSDGRAFGGEVIFTFDGDAAGQKAALKAFQGDQAFAAQTFVAVAKDGMDPCEVRMAYGDEGVRAIIDSRRPLFEFAIQSVLRGLPLNTAEGRAAGLRAAAPMVASIRDRVLRGEYTRMLSGWLGMDEGPVKQAVRESRGTLKHAQTVPAAAVEPRPEPVLHTRAEIRDPIERVEREALDVYLQLPWYAGPAQMDELPPQTFTVPIHHRIHEAIRAAGGAASYRQRFEQLVASGLTEPEAETEAATWYVERVIEAADPIVAQAVSQLAVETLPETRPERMERYVWSIAVSLIRQGITRQIADVRSELKRTAGDPSRQERLFERLMELETQRRTCDEQLE